LSRILESLLYGVTPHDPVAFAGAPLVLLLITLVASVVPARAASRIDPLKAIRTE